MNGKHLVGYSTSGKGITKIRRTSIIAILIIVKFSRPRLIKNSPIITRKIYSH
jgi:hypothetical protein